MNNFLTTIAALVFFVLSGSANADLSDSSLVPKKEAAFAGDYLQKLRERSFEHVKLHLAPELKAQVTDQKLEEVARYFPPGKLISAELVGSQTHTSPSAWQGNFSFE